MAAGYHAGGPIGAMGGKYAADDLERSLAKVASSKAASKADAAVTETIRAFFDHSGSYPHELK